MTGDLSAHTTPADLAETLLHSIEAEAARPDTVRTVRVTVPEAVACARLLEAFATSPDTPREFCPLIDRLTAIIWERVGY